MKVKDYKCKCGYNDFFFDDKGNQKGIYCSYCGKWLKWADKDEQNLTMKKEPKSEWEQDHAILKAYSDGQKEILDKLRAEIEELDNKVCQQFLIEDVDKEVHHAYQECLRILDKYKAETE